MYSLHYTPTTFTGLYFGASENKQKSIHVPANASCLLIDYILVGTYPDRSICAQTQYAAAAAAAVILSNNTFRTVKRFTCLPRPETCLV